MILTMWQAARRMSTSFYSSPVEYFHVNPQNGYYGVFHITLSRLSIMSELYTMSSPA